MPATPEEMLRDGDPAGALAALTEAVRARPADARLRVFLFQLLCVLGDWERALRQLKVSAELDAAAIPMAQTYREAIACELLRGRVFEGRAEPVVLGEPEAWVALLVRALGALAAGEPDRAAALRGQAFEEAPETRGELDGTPFAWIADADMRLGPVLEVIVAGRYYWLPFASVASLELDEPADLRDAVWTAAELTLRGGGRMPALIPTRYPGTTERGGPEARLARATSWEDAGGGAHLGVGQRMLVTDAAEVALMDLRQLHVMPSPVAADG